MKKKILLAITLLFSCCLSAQVYDLRQVIKGTTDDSAALLRYSNPEVLYRNNGSGWNYFGLYATKTFIPIYHVSGLDLLDSIVAKFNFIKRTGISAVGPLSYSSSTGIMSVLQAGAAQSGYLSFTDWNAFNNKLAAGDTLILSARINAKFNQPAGTTGQYLRGDGSPWPFPASLPPSGASGGDLTGTYPNPTLAASGVIAGTYDYVTVNSKGIVTGGYNSVTSSISTRTFGTAYRASDTTRSYDLEFSIKIQIGASLISANDGIVELQVSANGSTGWSAKTTIQNSNGGIASAQNGQSSFFRASNIPAGYYYRLQQIANTGTIALTYLNGFETLKR